MDLDPVGPDDDAIDQAAEQLAATGLVEVVDAFGDQLAVGDGRVEAAGVGDDLRLLRGDLRQGGA